MDTALILLIISTLFVGVGAKLWLKGSHLRYHGKKAKAIIFRNNLSKSGNNGLYHPVVRFLTDNNTWITQELSIGYSPPRKEGTEIEVIYDPDDPAMVEINSPFQLEILPALFVSAGSIGFLVGVLAYLEVIRLN